MKYQTERQKIKWEQAGEVLKVRGVLLTVGEFTGLEGRTTKFTFEALKRIADSIEGNIPFKVTHFSDKIVGYATKFALDETKGELLYEGYVFDQEAIDKIVNHGYDGVSAEIITELTADGVVEDGVITAIAFTPTPAVKEAGIEQAKVVSLSEGGEKEEVYGMSEEKFEEKKPTKDEFLAYIEGKLVEAGLGKEAIQKVMKVLKDVIKVPYPYPYPQPANMSADVEKIKQEYEQKLSEYEEKIKELQVQLEEYANTILEVKKNELQKLIEDLKKLGFADPEKIIEGVEDIDMQIKVLQNVKESAAVKKPEKKELEIKKDVEESKLEKLSKELGLTVEEVKELFGGEIE